MYATIFRQQQTKLCWDFSGWSQWVIITLCHEFLWISFLKTAKIYIFLQIHCKKNKRDFRPMKYMFHCFHCFDIWGRMGQHLPPFAQQDWNNESWLRLLTIYYTYLLTRKNLLHLAHTYVLGNLRDVNKKWKVQLGRALPGLFSDQHVLQTHVSPQDSYQDIISAYYY